MLDAPDGARLSKLYEDLRLKLLDLTRRNQLLNYSLSPRSRRFLQVIDATLDAVHEKLVNDELTLRILPLPEPDDIPAEERTEEFRNAFDRGKATDVEYLAALEAMDSTGRGDEAALERLDRQLRDRIRASMGFAPRPLRKELNRVEHARSHDIEPNHDLDPSRDIDVRALQTMKFPDELEAILEKISGDARLAEQEMGLSTLYLAFGFLEWYETDASDKKAFAPLLLLPVSLQKAKVRGKTIFSLSFREGGAEPNLSLQKLLEQRARVLPDFEVDEETGAGSIEAYLGQVKTAIDGLKRWKIYRWLVLGHFSFGRFAMYADLDQRKWGNVTSHDLVGSILHGVEQRRDPNALPTIPEDYPIDDPDIEQVAPFLIQDADASQHSALVDVMKGNNLVIQGPPGTGKSQTITNVIGNLLAHGKRVLFLAEKQAALEVVKRRLDRAGLGDFCLELHSDKASPKSIIASLYERYQLDTRGSSATAIAALDPVWQQNRREITSYVNALHCEAEAGGTAFGLIWKALRGRRSYADLMPAFKTVNVAPELLRDPVKRSHMRGEIRVLSDMQDSFSRSFGHPARSPWAKVEFGDFPSFEASRFVDLLATLREQVRAKGAAITRHAGSGIRTVEDFVAVAALNNHLRTLPDVYLLIAIANLDLDDLERALAVRLDLLSTEADLAAMPDLRHEDPERLAIAWAHLRGPGAAEFGDRTPNDAYSCATSEIELLTKLANGLVGVLPVLDALGLGPNTPSAWLQAVATAVTVLAIAPDPGRRWLLQLQEADERDVANAQTQLRTLLEADANWSSRLFGYGLGIRPIPRSLEAAAAILRKAGLGKLIAKLGGASREALALCNKLGADPSRPEDLDDLARHVRDLAAFENDGALRRLFGPAWAGLSTPVDSVREGVRIRLYMRSKIEPLAGGNEVLERAMMLSPEQAATLALFQDDCGRFLDLSTDTWNRLGEAHPTQLLNEIRTRISFLTEFLAIDPMRVLAGLDAPLRGIAHAHTVVTRLGRIRETLAGHATAAAAVSLGSSRERIGALGEAIAWVKSVTAAPIPGHLRERLLSGEAVEAHRAVAIAAHEWADIEKEFEGTFVDLTEFGVEAFASLPPNELIPLVDGLETRRAELSSFINIRQLRAKLAATGLTDFLAACEREVVEPVRIPGLFDALVTERRAAMARRVHILAGNNGDALETRRTTFAERDREKILADRETIRKRLLSVSPPAGSNLGTRKQWTEMTLLNNEFPKQKRFTPVRQLLTRAGKAIQVLKPCFMMSPLSLAKFVSPKTLEFDALVIDEASQMRPEDALGGMLRAKKIIVVGDPKQLPPTDFFSRTADAYCEDDDADDLDAESILEACESTFGQRRRLKWHYRSRCESLIAFSNSSFYDGSLVTFPSAKPGSFSVDLVRVDGVYRGKCNPDEAARVAQEAIAFMRHFADAVDDVIPTLGIAAVNLEQRDFIQEELQRLWADDELVERYRSKVETKGEPFFVKNLENVQGDERDYIFISMTYGKRQGQQALAQSFGPINRKQGHRRLNVLFTRARIRIRLFSSFGSADVRPTEQSSDGVHSLKRYLEYAETRGRAAVKTTGEEPDTDFEAEVADRLRAKGYEVKLQVGVSGFRVDIGVCHPDHPEHFLAGVECDGATYHSSKSARERDRLREDVLKSLGWDLVRVWSTDWFDNPDLEAEKLVRKLDALRQREPSAFESLRSVYGEDESAPEDEFESTEPGGSSEADAEVDRGLCEPRAKPPRNPPESIAEELHLVGSDGLDLFRGLARGPITPGEASKALEAFRETQIRPAMGEWDAQRSILRPAMIETFVVQRVSDPDMWHTRIPQYLRTGTDPAEKTRFLDEICEIVSRIAPVTRAPGAKSENTTSARSSDASAPRSAATAAPEATTAKPTIYVTADVASIARPDRERFHDSDYTPTLRVMIAHVVATEGPIFEDLLIERIARAHDLQRSGNQIRRRVVGLLPLGSCVERKDDEVVVWPAGIQPGHPFPFRRDPTGERSHESVPLEELASLAQPFLRLRLDDEGILRRMADEFSLGRLRASARARFVSALAMARNSRSTRC
jgi:very-short-patch-repair endonuclease